MAAREDDAFSLRNIYKTPPIPWNIAHTQHHKSRKIPNLCVCICQRPLHIRQRGTRIFPLPMNNISLFLFCRESGFRLVPNDLGLLLCVLKARFSLGQTSQCMLLSVL